MAKKNGNKITTTIRLRPWIRDALDAISEYEMRTLSNQIEAFLSDAITTYLLQNDLGFDEVNKAIKKKDELSS